MTVLESLLFSEYIKYLEANNINNIEYFKKEYIDYTNDNTIEKSKYLIDFLNYKLKQNEQTNIEEIKMKRFRKIFK